MSINVLPRLLLLLELLGRRGVVPGPELAAELDVDDRTLRRDVERLRDLGFRVEAVRGRHGGYRLARQGRLPPLVLEQQEAVALVIGLEAALRAGVRVQDAQRLADRVVRLLPADLAAGVDAVREVLELGQPSGDASLSPDRLLSVVMAARERRAASLRYRDARGHATERVVDVWGVVHHGRRWYVVGHDRLRDDVRTLRVDRVAALLDAGPRQVDPPSGFDATAHVAAQVTHEAWHHPVEVVFDAPVELVRARLPPYAFEIDDVDGATLLRTGADDLQGMAYVLAGTGLPCTVRTPVELADELAGLGRRLLARHRR